MDILPYTEDHRIFRDTARKFVEKEIKPFAEEWEEAGIVPRDIWRRMGQEGFLCVDVPEEYGGLGADWLYSVIFMEELTRATISGVAAPLHSDVVVPYITSYGSEEQKQKYLPGCVSGDIVTAVAMTEPDAGSDLSGMRTTATDDGDHVVLNGQKTFISNGLINDLVIVAAKDAAEEDPYKAVSLFIVEDGTPGYEKGQRIKKAGWHSQDTAELFFHDCRIPAANRLGRKGQGFYQLMEKLQQERLVVAIGAQASAERCLEWTMDYVKERKAFGKPISKFQNTQFKLVEMATEVKIGRTFVDKLVADHIEGKNIVVDVSMAKYWTSEMACRVADGCLQLFGGYGYCDEYPISRAWRDTRVMRIFAGTNEIMKVVAAKFMGL
jgi:acyl-CoA dehydrogenase